MKKRKFALLVLALWFAASARADSVTNLSGQVKGLPGESFSYSFNVQSFNETFPDGTPFILDVLNGQVLTKYGAVGCHPCIETFTNDFYEFLPNETITMLQFGQWNLMADSSHVWLVDPPSVSSVATPEASVVMSLILGILSTFGIAVLFGVRRRPR